MEFAVFNFACNYSGRTFCLRARPFNSCKVNWSRAAVIDFWFYNDFIHSYSNIWMYAGMFENVMVYNYSNKHNMN